ncbi:TIGR02117 family protein [Flavobacterium sp.]|uniref:TIGR02117 family protein n=1 Tax=Flavobacterium sp. TaxID=239 RepID=UPI00262E545D|nr:TIGR02117 family protein [Flavobacterium sp.]
MRNSLLFKVYRGIRIVFLSLLTFIGFYLLLAATIGYITISGDEITEPKTIEIYLQTNGVHSELVLPVKNQLFDWNGFLDKNLIRAKNTYYPWVAIGWGNREFYLETPTWSDLKLSTAIKAASGFNETAVHVNYYQNRIEHETCKKIVLSDTQYRQLVTHYLACFQQNESKPIAVKTGIRYNDRDAFYESNGNYSLFKTCNTFTNQALAAASVEHCLWTPFDFHVMRLQP